MGLSHTFDCSQPTKQNWVVCYKSAEFSKIVVNANPGSAAVLNIYDYDDAGGNIPEVSETWRVIRVTIPAASTQAAPFSVPFEAKFHRGLTVRASVAELNVAVIYIY